jgi:hypothetical protein
MPQLQEFAFGIHDKTKIEVYLVRQLDSSIRALIMLPVASAKLLSWHERPHAHANAKDAFVWALRHAAHFCKRIGSEIVEVTNPTDGELISAADQQRIVDVEGISAAVRISGAASA